MLELFEKHLAFIAPELKDLTYEKNEKHQFKFVNELVNKHWLSFRAIYSHAAKKGQIDALNQIKVECAFKVEELMK